MSRNKWRKARLTEHKVKSFFWRLSSQKMSWVGAWDEYADVVILLISDWKNPNYWAHKGCADHGVGDQVPFQEVKINVEPLGGCIP